MNAINIILIKGSSDKQQVEMKRLDDRVGGEEDDDANEDVYKARGKTFRNSYYDLVVTINAN